MIIQRIGKVVILIQEAQRRLCEGGPYDITIIYLEASRKEL